MQRDHDHYFPPSWHVSGRCVLRHLFSISFGLLYLGFISKMAAGITGTPLALSVLVVVSGAIVLMLIMGRLATGLVRPDRGDRQFNLTTIFLLMVIFSIYFAAIGSFFRHASAGNVSFGPIHIFVAIGLCGLFIVASTVFLLCLAESLVSIAAFILHYRAWRRWQQTRSQQTSRVEQVDQE